MKQTLQLDVSQRLTMTPALQQAIRLLQLSSLELKSEINTAVEANLMLEFDEPEPADAGHGTDNPDAGSDTTIPEDLAVDADWSDIYTNGQASAGHTDTSADPSAYLAANTDLHSHLAWQADLHPFSPQERRGAAYIIDAIDARGRLSQWPELQQILLREHNLQSHQSERILAAIQSFEPGGAGARSLAECLSIQLRQLEPQHAGRALALQLVEGNDLDQLAGNADALARRLKVATTELRAAQDLLHSLQPDPGAAFSHTQPEYVIPEIYAVRRESGWHAQLNSDIAPRLRINDRCLGLIDQIRSKQDRATLRTHLKEAHFFLNSIASRNETLLRVAGHLVEVQGGFLDYGETAMRPLMLQDVAERLNMHESTVSRATTNKFMQTPRGIFELKHFFSTRIADPDGGSISATAIQAMIKRLINAEQPGKPLSDTQLATLLHDTTGIPVARRTVSKYRGALAIASSSQRRHRPR